MDNRGMRTFRAAMLALAATAAGMLASGQQARADLFNFNPTGSAASSTYSINGLGFGAGNALAVGAIPLSVGKTFQVYFQTHLTSLTGPTAPASVPGLNSTFQITEVATLSETVTSFNPATGTATFALNPAGVNQIKIYESPTVVFNDAAGTGFTAGQVIATIDPTTFTSSNYTDATQAGSKPTAAFNQTGAGNTTTKTADQGSGGTGILNTVVSYDKNFFNPPNGTPLLTSSIFNSNLASVFDAVSPSLLFTNPVTSATIASNPGANNGTSGPDFQLQVSGFTQSFGVVPEPASMTLFGLGLAGVAAFARRKRNQVA